MKIGIIGTGRIAGRFTAECETVDGIDIKAVYNPHEGSAERFTDRYFEGRGSKPLSLTDIEGFLESVDAVYIASPHETHFSYILEALKHGCHVLCEKPMVLKVSEAEEALALAAERNLVLMEGLKTAYCPGYKKLLDLVDEGVIGDVRNVEACFTKLESPDKRELSDRAYGGSFTELGSYVMLPLFDILGSGYRDVLFESIKDAKGLDLFTKLSVRYDNAVSTLTCGLGVKSEGRLVISGTKGFIKVPAPWWKTRQIEVHFEDESKTECFDEPFEGDGLRYELKFFKEMTEDYHKDKMTGACSRSICMADMMERFLSGRRVP